MAERDRTDDVSPSVIVPSLTLQGESIAVPSASSEEPSVAGPSSSMAGESITSLGGETSYVAERSDGEEEEGTASSGRSPQEILGGFAEDWLDSLDKEEIKSISLFLCYNLVSMFSFTETKAAEYAAAMVNKNERTVR